MPQPGNTTKPEDNKGTRETGTTETGTRESGKKDKEIGNQRNPGNKTTNQEALRHKENRGTKGQENQGTNEPRNKATNQT